MNLSLRLFLRANRRHLGELALAGLLVNALALALPVFSLLVYDKAVGNRIHDTLWALALGVTLAFAMELLVRLARVLILEHAAARWDANLDERLLRGVLAAPLAQALPVGQVLTRYRDVGVSRDVLSSQQLLPLGDVPFALLFALALWVVAGPLVLVPLAVGALLLGLTLWLHQAGQQRTLAANRAHGQKMQVLVDLLLARDSLAARGAAAQVQADFRRPALAGARASARARVWAQFSQQAVPFGLGATTVGLLVAGVYRIEAQALSVGGLIAATMIGGRLVAVLAAVAPVLARWSEFRLALDKLRADIDLDAAAPAEGQALDAATQAAFLAAGVRLDQLGCRFPGQDRPVLDGLTLQLQAGELVAVVGASGAGKSSLLRLLAGQQAHDRGELAVAGDRIDGETARRRLAALAVRKPQDPVFMPGPVRAIVAPEGAEDTSVLAALRHAGLGPALDRGELGLNTLVGSAGQGLSGGQRQMLALARALHARTPLLLLDEPTNGLDRQAQDALLAHLLSRPAGRCTLVATHAAEFIQRCDRVLVLDRGRLVADAPPSRLMPSSAAPAVPAASAASATPAAPPRPIGPVAMEPAHA